MAVEEARQLELTGFQGLLIENMHDRPYCKPPLGPEITAALTAICCAIRQQTHLPIGLQILAAANIEALAVAQAAELDFIRCEGFVFGHIADEGYIDGCAGALLRYRKSIGADKIQIWTDIKKKHAAHMVTADISIEETSEAASFFLSDGLIITGSATGKSVVPQDLISVKHATTLPVYIGSGITPVNINQYVQLADGFIVGSSLKKQGLWSNPLDIDAMKQLVENHKQLCE